jgi:cation:H+ antiporter
MLLAILGLAAGLALLTYASDQFVVGAARIATSLRLSAVVIGAVVIGVGTSAPELLVSVLAAAQGSLDIAVGNIVGSNVANLTLVLGVAAILTPIAVHGGVLRREAPISLGAVLLLGVLLQRGFGTIEGIVLLVALGVALLLVLRSARGGDPDLEAEVVEFLTEGPPARRREALRTALGLLGTLGAAQLLVVSAVTIAREAGLAEGFVGLTVVAIGTSLPELATSIQAARKHETDLIVGNLLGSNLFNSTAVAGAVAIAGPGTIQDPKLTGLAVALMVGTSALATLLMVTERTVVRWEGVVLLVGYVAVLPLLA